ncbi:MAG: DUF1837 domain-containing protein [Pantoea agglomerans]
MEFDIIFDNSLSSFVTASDSSLGSNNSLVSIVNDFEDGLWRDKKFHRFIWDNILLTALSIKERNALIDVTHSSLAIAAQNLRLTDKDGDIGKGSELAEIFLYGIMRHHFKALPVVPKIFYKQNAQDNAKGADSVHIVLTGESDFTLWFGEAKFYNSLDDSRFDSIITSVVNSLNTEKLKKENSLIVNTKDLYELIEAPSLKAKISETLSERNSIDNIKSIINIPIFILHECSITEKCNDLTIEYKNSIIDLHKKKALSYFKKHKEKIKSIYHHDKIKFHLILFPVPEKKSIIEKFLQTVKFYKDL